MGDDKGHVANGTSIPFSTIPEERLRNIKLDPNFQDRGARGNHFLCPIALEAKDILIVRVFVCVNLIRQQTTLEIYLELNSDSE